MVIEGNNYDDDDDQPTRWHVANKAEKVFEEKRSRRWEMNKLNKERGSQHTWIKSMTKTKRTKTMTKTKRRNNDKNKRDEDNDKDKKDEDNDNDWNKET